jgi:putative sigma-54 modulation protein
MSRKTKAQELERAYDITVTGRHILVTDAMKNYAMDKISKIERFSSRIIDVNVIMDIQKLQHRVDILCWINNLKIKASASSVDMYASIDKAVDRLLEQLLKHKDRMQDHHSTTHEDLAMNENVYSPLSDDELSDFNEIIEGGQDRELLEKYRPHKIVDKETRPIKILNHSEAILKMDLSGDPFLIFQSEEDHEVKIIYRRGDGNYGIVEWQK